METTVTTLTRRVAGNLRAEMGRRGYVIRDLADVLNVSVPTASTRYNGIRSLDMDEIALITAWLGIGWGDLIVPRNTPDAAPDYEEALSA